MSYAPSASEALPRAPEPDSTLAFLREGYLFGLNRFRRLGTDAFEARLGLRRVLYVHGAEAAAMFYASDRFTRRGAIPPSTLTLLQDFGSVQRLDGAAHRHRKAMFMRLLDVSAATRLVLEFRDEWERRLARWTHERALVLHDEIEAILCRAACRWAGVALAESEADARSRDFSAMIDGAGAIGARFARGMLARYRVERWLRDEIARLRARGEDDRAASCIAHHREPDGRPLDERVAAVELINLLRPTVALARWVTFAALALHQYPLLRPRLRAREPRLLLHVVQEVRRFYPFFPAVGGRVRVPFEWRGRRFEPGEWVMLDLYATDHDERLWHEPHRFDPDRFRRRTPGAFDLIPQGAGDYAHGHRCPGENPGIALLMSAVDALATRIDYDVPAQDLTYPFDRLPSLPVSRFVIARVRGRR